SDVPHGTAWPLRPRPVAWHLHHSPTRGTAMQEAMRTYLELAMGLTEASRKKVRKVVKDAVGRSGATADQVKTLTSDLMATNSANRDALSKLVRFEVDRALGVV